MPPGRSASVLTCIVAVERVTGIEPASPTWKHGPGKHVFAACGAKDLVKGYGLAPLTPSEAPCAPFIMAHNGATPDCRAERGGVMPRRRRTKSTGSIRANASGTWSARVYLGRGRHVALGSFDTKEAAERALILATADRERGSFVDPAKGEITLKDYAGMWLRHRPLRPRTVGLYDQQLRTHILPTLGELPLGRISPMQVRRWYGTLVKTSGLSPVTAAKCYRLLRTILTTAVEDELIAKNPCALKGAGNEKSPERPVATVQQVAAIADAVDPRFRALILMATYSTLRWGELTALTRRRIDLDNHTVTVVEQSLELADGSIVIGPPKSDAGHRTVALPPTLVTELQRHLDEYVDRDRDALVFLGAKGAQLRRANWNVKWKAACAAAGVEGLRFHDLRHTGNTLAAASGASTKELMARMGHSSPRAALIYQHATKDRDRAIALALEQMIVAAAPS